MRLVPSDRMIGWTLVLVPFALLYAIDPHWLALAVMASAILALLAGIDAWLGLATPCPISATMDPVQRLSRNHAGTATVHLHAEHPVRPFLLGLDLNESIDCPRNPASIAMPTDTADASYSFELTPSLKGSFPLTATYLEDRSPLGFWRRRHELPTESELRVYPDMQADRKRLAAHFLHRNNAGLQTIRLVGQGREFERLREYMPGDSYSDIHWKATAKRNRPVTKLFQVEHTQEIVVAIDAARLSARHHGDETALDRYIAAALLLGQITQQQGDQFGILVFSDRIDRFIRPGMGPGHYNACRDAIFSTEPKLVSPSYGELFTFLRLRLRRRAMVLLLTDLGDSLLAENFLEHVQMISRSHLLSVAMPRPPGPAQLFSHEAGSIDDLYQQLGSHLAAHRLDALKRELGRRGVPLTLAAPGELAMTLVRRYFEVKARQQL